MRSRLDYVPHLHSGEALDLLPQLSAPPDTEGGRVRLSFQLVGNFEARASNGQLVQPTSKKARALLALIAAQLPQPLRRDTAAALLWSTKSREHAANSLRQALRELQLSLLVCGLPCFLMAGGGKLAFPVDEVWVDLHDPAAIRPPPPGTASAQPLLLCQNLHGLDPALDAHFERLWKNLVFQQAFAPTADEVDAAELGGLRPGIGAAGNEAGHHQGWRIAVLPFRCLGLPAEAGLSLGMAEEVSAALAKFRMPRLIATGSFWDGNGAATDALARCREYNLDYAICGTVQGAGQRLRVTVTLMDVAMDFEVIWASRFEGTTEDLFTLQDTIAAQTVAQIDPELLQRQPYRDAAVQTPDAAAHQALLAGIQGVYRPDKVRFFQARTELERAVALDQGYAAAHAWLAYWYVIGMAEGWIVDLHHAASQAGEASERAVSLDPLDARGLSIAGHVKAYMEHDLRAALSLHERAISLNPNLPAAWALGSWSHIYDGSHETAFEQASIAEALSPTDPHVFVVEHAAMTAKFFLGDLESADRYAVSSLERRPRHATALKVRLAILGHLGRRRQAEVCLDAIKALGLDVTVDAIIARPPLRAKDRAFYAEGLLKAGVSY